MNPITREQWGAKDATPNYSPQKPARIILHHSATPLAVYKGVETIRTIQRYHQHHMGWQDIGYHYLIGPEGNIYEGRPSWAAGAHAKGYNRHTIGICVIGDYQAEKPTPEALEAVKGLIVTLEALYERSLPVTGHRDNGKTLCPGDNLYKEIGGLSEAV